MRTLVTCFLLFSARFHLFSQVEPINPTFSFSYVNDLFTKTDRFYSQGISLGYSFVPMVRVGNDSSTLFHRYSLELMHDVYTPSTIKEAVLLPGDRPYAGVLEISFRNEQTSKSKGMKSFWGVSCGVIGSAAGGKQMQTTIHLLTDNFLPLGWNGQLSNGFILQTKGGLQRRFFYNKFSGLEGLSFAEIGTLRTNFNLVATIKLGKLNGNNHIFLSWTPEMRIVGYDGTLQGAVFAGKNGNEVPSSLIKRFVSEQNIQLNYRFVSRNTTLRWECAAIYHFQSALMEGVGNHRWGGLRVKFGIGG